MPTSSDNFVVDCLRLLAFVILTGTSSIAQVATALPPNETTTGSGPQQADGISARPDQSQQRPSQPQRSSPPPQEQDSGQVTPVPQSESLVGTVTDVNEDPVAGASVVLDGADLNDRRTVATNDLGFFDIRDLKPGILYHVAISADGFANWTSDVFLEPGQHKILTGIQL